MPNTLPIQIHSTRLVSSAEVVLPVLYKYRAYGNPRHLEAITNRELFLAPPSSFDDEYDCNLETRPSLLTSQERADWAERSIVQQFPALAKAPAWERRAYAQYYADFGPIVDQNHVAEVRKHARRLLDNRFGVLCLTPNPSSNHMWGAYADDFNGFCIGYKPETFQTYSSGPVTYVPQLPVFRGNEDHGQRFQNLIFLKHEQYALEEEYRVHRFWGENATTDQRKVLISPTQIAEVIIGYRVPPDFIDFVHQNLPGVPIRTARPDGNGGVTLEPSTQ
jgi:hypothetical protein